MKDTYRYVIHAYEDVRQKRPMKHEHGGTTVETGRSAHRCESRLGCTMLPRAEYVSPR
jgi:hypothetical protein